jgi:hypothetical protein
MQNWRKFEDGTLARTLALVLSLAFAGGCSLRTLAVNEVENVIKSLHLGLSLQQASR